MVKYTVLKLTNLNQIYIQAKRSRDEDIRTDSYSKTIEKMKKKHCSMLETKH